MHLAIFPFLQNISMLSNGYTEKYLRAHLLFLLRKECIYDFTPKICIRVKFDVSSRFR